MKKTFKNFSWKSSIILGAMSCLVLGIVYSVYANSQGYYNIITNGGDYIRTNEVPGYTNIAGTPAYFHGPGWVNITPNGVADIDSTKAQLSYDISFASILGLKKDRNNLELLYDDSGHQVALSKLYVLIPTGAENIKFTLKGTMQKNSHDDFGQISTPVDVDIPLLEIPEWENGETIPTANTVAQNNITSLKALKVLWDDLDPYINGFTLYEIHGNTDNAHPVMVNVVFDMKKKTTLQYIPIRAWLDKIERYLLQDPFDSSIEYFAIKSQRLENIPENLHFYMPQIDDIKPKDFDKHGLYRDSTACAVTRNLSRWYKMGNDIDGVNHKISQWLLWFDGIFLGTWNLEDACDQAAQEIGINPDYNG